MAMYKCNRIVEAIQIKRIHIYQSSEGNSFYLYGDESDELKPIVTNQWVEENSPEIGGYYMLYENGLSEYMAKDLFEKNYSKDTSYELSEIR